MDTETHRLTDGTPAVRRGSPTAAVLTAGVVAALVTGPAAVLADPAAADPGVGLPPTHCHPSRLPVLHPRDPVDGWYRGCPPGWRLRRTAYAVAAVRGAPPVPVPPIDRVHVAVLDAYRVGWSIDELVARRKAAWAADRVARRLL